MALSTSRAPIMWNGTIKNRLPLIQSSWRVTVAASSGIERACVLPASSRSSTAMKWLLPAPKEPCK